MNHDDIEAATRDLPGGPVELVSTEMVMHRLANMNPTLTVGFITEYGEIPDSKEAAVAQLDAHERLGDQPITSDDYVNRTAVALDVDSWRAMGEPETITVTIEPSDTLSAPHASNGFGPVSEVQHIPGRDGSDASAVVRHRHEDPTVDTRPQHDDVTNDDVRVTQLAEPVEIVEHEVRLAGEHRSV